MPVGVTHDHRELSSTLRAWAVDLDGIPAVRATETATDATYAEVWRAIGAAGLAGIALGERYGGGGGDLLDQMIGLEAAAYALVPGPLLGTIVVGLLVDGLADDDAVPPRHEELLRELASGGRAAIALSGAVHIDASGAAGNLTVVLDVVDASWLLAPTGNDEWVLISASGWTAEPALGIDLSRRGGRVQVAATSEHVVLLPNLDHVTVTRVLVALAAAEAAGVAQWCLDTAVAYAKVREQFGVPIGSFQAVKHLCAGMLEVTESVAAVAWDVGVAAMSGETSEQVDYATQVAAVVAFDGAVSVAQDCIQVLGGIGFTFEHDAHLYLRRAIALRAIVTALTGGAESSAVQLAHRAVSGQRRTLEIDFDGADEEFREKVRQDLVNVATLPEPERRAALAVAGYLTPHWSRPFGLDASPLEQLVVDQELTRAELARPNLAIGAWAAPTLIEHGTDTQREQFVLPTLLGEIAWCQLFSEPGAGSDLASLRTRATKADGGWRLTGQKVWTSLAHEADWAICLARTDPDVARHKGISYFLIDMKSPGIEIRPLREMTGDAMFNEVFLDDVLVPDEYVVGSINNGWKLARTTLANERVAMAGTKLGLSTERAVELLAGRNSPTDAARVGRQVALATICHLLGARSTLRSIAGSGPGPESSVAKLLGVRNRQEASELVIDLHGPATLFAAGDQPLAADVHEMLLTRCLSIAGGTTQILRNVVAERVLGLPRG